MRVSVWAGRLALAVLSAGLLAGCKTWQATTVSPERLIAEERPSSVRVTTSDGVTITLRDPSVVNDSILSRASGTGTALAGSRPGVERRNVSSLEVARFSPGRTIMLASAIVAISIGWANLADSRGGSTVVNEPLPKEPALSLGGWLGLLLGR